MGKAPLSREAALRLYPMDRFEHLRFIEVEGELREATGERWSALLHGAVAQRAEASPSISGVVVVSTPTPSNNSSLRRRPSRLAAALAPSW